ncbi:hypothetical protein SDC9_110719 [bioreactor metagenome]|uniref:MORN repeat variant n=1 Tax=bioreactor metagenome TaxID=1076179 RepID=A0A645BEG0_9ZZZZ
MKKIAVIIFLIHLQHCVFAEENLFPSKYIGIFSIVEGKRNGQLDTTQIGFSGKWENEKFRIQGYYKNGIPDSTWIAFYPNGIPQIVKNYSKSSYVFSSYYPDSLLALHTIGRFEVAPNSFTEYPQNIQYWDQAGNMIPSDIFRSNSNRWQWGNNERAIPEQQRDFSGTSDIKLISRIISSDTVLFALYFYSDKYFLEKSLFRRVIDPNTGALVLQGKPTDTDFSLQYRVTITNERLEEKSVISHVNIIGTQEEKPYFLLNFTVNDTKIKK